MDMESNKQGLWLREDKCFYVLETGPQKVLNEVDRLRTIMAQRGMRMFNTREEELQAAAQPYIIYTVKEAQEKNYEFKVIYLNNHIRRIVESQAGQEGTRGAGWG